MEAFRLVPGAASGLSPRSDRDPAGLVGRAELYAQASSLIDGGLSVLLVGPAGIGKSTMLDALAQPRPGVRILRAAAAEVESGLPYLTLIDLFSTVLAEHAGGLPAHLRTALDSALLRTAPPGGPQDELAVHLAVLELLRSLAARSPVLMVIDDLHWVDEPSAAVLRFVARRLAGLPVRMLAAHRVSDPGDGVGGRAELCPTPRAELSVGPLSQDAVADLLRARFGSRFSLATLNRVHTASGGNPLFAVEVGRALSQRDDPLGPTEPLPLSQRLRDLLSARVAALPAEAMGPLVVLAAAARPSVALLQRAGIDPANDLRPALSAGVVRREPDGSPRFSHPLLREMVYADAAERDRTAAHELLAAATDDSVERARHLALARPYPDEALATTLVEAANVARRRGAPAIATDLARLAALRSPDPPGAAARILDAAGHAHAAGLSSEALALAGEALTDQATAETRIRARLLLIDLAGQDFSAVASHFDAALADLPGAPELAGRVRLARAGKAFYDGDSETGFVEFKLAEQAALASGDTECVAETLARRAEQEVRRDPQLHAELMERAASISEGLPLSSAVAYARQLTIFARLTRGEVGEAVRRIEALRSAVERSGTVYDMAFVLLSAASVYTRAGRCADALAAGRTCLRYFTDVGATSLGPPLFVAAMVELAGGDADRAYTLIDRAIAASVADGDDDYLQGCLAGQGQILLMRGDAAGAASVMRRAHEMSLRRGPDDPARFLWHADLIEALAGAGARDEAAAVLTETRMQARKLGRSVCELGLDRAEAMLVAAGGDVRAATAGLAEALGRWADHPYPLEVARAWHALGGLERRAHRRGAARDALHEAITRYSALGAVPWQQAAAAELARLDGGRGAALSETERRIVDHLRAGATNREIARSTFLSVKAVEANLTRLYRRFGVRNRDQLTRLIEHAGGDL